MSAIKQYHSHRRLRKWAEQIKLLLGEQYSSSSSSSSTGKVVLITGDDICAVGLTPKGAPVVLPYTEANENFLEEYFDEVLEILVKETTVDYRQRLVTLQCLREEGIFNVDKIALQLIEQDFVPYLRPGLLDQRVIPASEPKHGSRIPSVAAATTITFSSSSSLAGAAAAANTPGTGLFAPTMANFEQPAEDENKIISILVKEVGKRSIDPPDGFKMKLANCRDLNGLKELLNNRSMVNDTFKTAMHQLIRALIHEQRIVNICAHLEIPTAIALVIA